MYQTPPHTRQHPAVPDCEHQPQFTAVPPPARWRYKPRRTWWRTRAARAGAVVTVLALCALVILAIVRDQTGTHGFLVGLGLAVLPVPLLVAAFRWLDRVEPEPWRNLVFAFAWGAFAAALVAIIANSFATRWIATATADPAAAESLGATVIAPVVEESAKAAAILLIFLFRRRDFTGLVDGVVVAGFTATGFAFTENILYLGNAFGEDQDAGASGLASVTAATFFVRIVMSPFAHPLFTVLTGMGFGLAAVAPPRRRRWRRIALPLLGLALAMAMHALWNGSAVFGGYGFYLVYAVFMVPAFALVTWLAVWTRQRELRTIATELPAYAAAGWLLATEPLALSSMRARALARGAAARTYGGAAGGRPGSRAAGRAAARAVAEYETFATSLAFLRHRAGRGALGPDFPAREQELLHHLWQRREVAGPALEYAARAAGRVRTPPPWPPQWHHPPPQPSWQPYGYGYGYGPPPHQEYAAYNPYRQQ
ncbi:PrsW family intramembrane metalloprotease [Streptomyces agglomeratus]|uniref:PrsW family intramembrane metalloprotease n=1 Tax=Streptomyces agglomeratus TaxID=285458 RepID=UPI00099F67DA|nr:PrsW family intramembrane metalloprotease [Streptomyces agglomeratus]